jgi:SAM-dependent methyltransferase
MNIPNNWFEDFFHGITLDLWRKAIPPEQTQREADFLVKTLVCARDARLLDVPCGNGRLSFALAKRGFRVTGVDISEEFIEEANDLTTGVDNPPADAGGPDPEFILGDMRYLELESNYDGAFCFGNSFGFMDYEAMENFLGGIRKALKPGARFIVNSAMAAESVLPDFEEQSCHEIEDIVVTIKERYAASESCIDSEYVFEHDGKTESRKARHWIYTVAEIQRMLTRAGFKVIDCYGSLKSEPFKLGSRELFVVAEAE